jgi:hypothetical protein
MESFNNNVNMITDHIDLLRQDVVATYNEYPNLKYDTDSETQVEANEAPRAPSKATMDELYNRMDDIDEEIFNFAALIDFTNQLPMFATLVITARMLRVELERMLFAIWTNDPVRLQQDFLAWFYA